MTTTEGTEDIAWSVEVYGYMPEVFYASTKAKARWKAYRQFCEAFGRRPFQDFLAIGVSIREADAVEIERARDLRGETGLQS